MNDNRNYMAQCRMTEVENRNLIDFQKKNNFKNLSDCIRYLITLGLMACNDSPTPQKIESQCIFTTEINRLREYTDQLYDLAKPNSPYIEPFDYSIIERSMKNLWHR